MWRFKFSFPMALTNVETACYTSTSAIILYPLFKTWQTKIRADCRRLDSTHSESRSYSTNYLCCVRSMNVFATDILPTQQSKTREIWMIKLQMISFDLDIIFCSGQSKALALDALEPVLKSRLSRSIRKTLDIRFLNPECVDFMFPGVLQ